MNPSNRRRLPANPEEWLIHAQSDLIFAQLGKENSGVLPQQICFHAQQAAEKGIKAVLLSMNVDFPLTHDIEELIDICDEADITLPSDLSDVGLLTPYAVETRYPGYLGAISEDDVTEAIKLADNVIVWAESIILKTK